MPVVQLRRFVDGWRYALAAGYGTQRDAESGWRAARLFEASVTSPKEGHAWSFQAGFTYTNTPSNSGAGYDYRQLFFSVGRTF
jgi:hypothetical protein